MTGDGRRSVSVAVVVQQRYNCFFLFLVLNVLVYSGAAKMQEFQIKTSDGSTVDILIKPLVSGLVVKKAITFLCN